MKATITVVGAGPAGIVVALELARKGHEVLLIESGGGRPDARTQALGDAAIVDPSKHVAMGLATRRQIGGASNIWGGRCVPYDPIDFDRRPFMPDSEWPIAYDDIAPYFPRTSDWFFTGRPAFNSHDIPEIPHKSLVPGLPDGDVLSSSLERWSLPTNFGKHYSRELKTTPPPTPSPPCVAGGSTAVRSEFKPGITSSPAAAWRRRGCCSPHDQ